MKEVTIEKNKLMEIVKENRGNHRALFEKAQAGYKSRVMEILEQRLEEARRGRHVDLAIYLPEPTDQTTDYDRIIRMLELEIGDEIVLSQSEFAQYVQDDWSWKKQFVTTSAHYVN